MNRVCVLHKCTGVFWRVCAATVLVALLCGCGVKADPAKQELKNQPTQMVTDIQQSVENKTDVQEGALLSEDVLIETSVCKMLVPETAYDVLAYKESTQDGAATCIFYAVTGESEQEAFRIIFTTAPLHNSVGLLKTETEDLFISVSVCEYNEEDFFNNSAQENYYMVVSALNTVMESIYADERFRHMDAYEIQESNAEFTYWSVNLPDKMEWEESNEDTYMVTFYGNIGDEKIKLYSICIGDTQLSNQLGFFSINKNWLAVTMESYPLSINEEWSDAQVAELYNMMSTINDVIQAVMANENFIAELPE